MSLKCNDVRFLTETATEIDLIDFNLQRHQKIHVHWARSIREEG